jgi:hypothetical protein
MASDLDVAVAGYFNANNRLAWRLAKIAAGKMITYITDETLLAVRVLIKRAIREGIPPNEVARLVLSIIGQPGATTNEQPGMLGLNHIQVQDAMNYRETLINMGHNQDTVDKLLGKYVAKKLKRRASMIARTETMWALNTAAQAQYRQAVKDGFLAGGYLKWIITPDEKTCEFCITMNGRTKPIPTANEDTMFHHPNGKLLFGPPAHPNCRCTVAYSETEYIEDLGAPPTQV